MKRIGIVFIAIFLACNGARAFIIDEEIFSRFSVDSLAPRDEHGLLHQELLVQPAYVGALQRDLRRLGYYCGPIDGIFSDDVGDAIARLQKNYSMRVSGTLTDPLRRALHLP